MKKEVHPEYREVLFHDTSIDKYFVVPSSLMTDETKEWEGKTYPYFPLDISSDSHPFYTGKQKMLDSGGRVKKFQDRFGASGASKPTAKKVEAKVEETAIEEVAEETLDASVEEVIEETVAEEAEVEEVTEEASAEEVSEDNAESDSENEEDK